MVSTFVTLREANDQMEFFELRECTQYVFIPNHRLCFVRQIMFCCFDSLISVNISSVMLGRVFLCCTSTKQQCLAQGHNTVTLTVVRRELATLRSILRRVKFIWAQSQSTKIIRRHGKQPKAHFLNFI